MTAASPDHPDTTDPQLNSDIDGGRHEPPFRPGLIRTKVIPAVAMVMVIGLLGLLAYSLFAPDDARRAGGAHVKRSGLVVYDNPRPAPLFTLDTFEGETFSLEDQRGKIVLLNFWGSWCGPCRDETPLLVTAASALDDDVVLFGVDVWEQSESDGRAFLEEFAVNYPTGYDADGDIPIDYGITGVPETFVIDANGNIVAKMPGPVTSVAQIREMVEEGR